MINFPTFRYDARMLPHLTISIVTYLPLLVFSCIVLWYRHFILIWDARNYFTHWIFPLVEYQNFNLKLLDCNQHGAVSYAVLYSFLQFFDLRNTLFIHLSTLIIMLLGFVYFGLILKYLFKKKSWIFIGLACLCFNPALLANTINPTPDLLAFAFSLPCLYYLLIQRLHWAAFFGFLLLFSKEVGVIDYTLGCFFYLVLLRRQQPIFKIIYQLSWPFLAYFLLIAMRIWSHTHSLFKGFQFSALLLELVKPPDLHFYSAFKLVSLLNFQWIIVSVIAISGILALILRVIPTHKKKFKPEILFLTFLLGSLTWILCSYPTFLNARYFLLIFPLTTLLFVNGLQRLSVKIAYPFSASLLGLLLLSCFFTIDPISKREYGVFSFGQHDLLKMTSQTKECCGYGRDQLIYNLQYTKLINLLNLFSQQMHLAKNDLILIHPLVNYFLFANVDDRNYQWTLRARNAYQPYLVHTVEEAKTFYQRHPNGRLFYIAFPNIEAKQFESNLLRDYQVNSQITLNDQGYSITAYQLRI